MNLTHRKLIFLVCSLTGESKIEDLTGGGVCDLKDYTKKVSNTMLCVFISARKSSFGFIRPQDSFFFFFCEESVFTYDGF